MDRELLLEIGCEELPASWLPALTEQLAQRLGQRLKDFRLSTDGPIESSATPRRLTAHVARVAERQSDLEENVSGPAVAAAFGPDGAPTPAAVGFARKYGVDVAELTRVSTAKGEYLSVVKRERGRAGGGHPARRARRDAARPAVPQADALGRVDRRRQGRVHRSAVRSGGCCSCSAAASCRS